MRNFAAWMRSYFVLKMPRLFEVGEVWMWNRRAFAAWMLSYFVLKMPRRAFPRVVASPHVVLMNCPAQVVKWRLLRLDFAQVVSWLLRLDFAQVVSW